MNAVVASTSSPACVDIELDGQAHTVPAGTTLAELVSRLGHAEQAVATALNQCFVARPLRAQAVLQSGDQVLLFQPIVGG
ncbi:MAG: sulfur carrier protein ThiS [Pseudomonadota bacterium]